MKLDVTALRYLSQEDFAVLVAVEMGSRNHEVVPLRLISQLSKMRPGGLSRILSELQKLKLVSREPAAKGGYEGIVLGYGGYDYLALRAFSQRSTVTGVGRQIGVGKESDIYEVFGEVAEDGYAGPRVMKLQRLGRTSFRTVKNNRDYIGKRQHYSWLYLSKLAATKEWSFLQALWQHGFPVPRPIDHSRHVIVMQQILGTRLDELRWDMLPGDTDEERLAFAEAKRQECLDLLLRITQHGLIHGDFNEFNLLLEDSTLRIVMIDFPQMVSVHHLNAREYFERDLDGVCRFFERRFHLPIPNVPSLEEIVPSLVSDLGRELGASGNRHVAERDCGDGASAEGEDASEGDSGCEGSGESDGESYGEN